MDGSYLLPNVHNIPISKKIITDVQVAADYTYCDLEDCDKSLTFQKNKMFYVLPTQ